MPVRATLRASSVLATLVLTGCTGQPTAGDGADEVSVATSVPTTDDSSPAGPQPLLPDLTTLRASSIQLDADDDRLLRFGTTLANVGRGPMETVPDAASPCPAGERSFRQVVTIDADDDGRYAPGTDVGTTRQGGACAVFHPTHSHWHIDGSARYELRDAAGAAIASTDKVSFCLRDTDRVPGLTAPTGATYAECARNRLQGISPGWGDLYDYDLDGQTLRLPGSAGDGRYCLVMTADPLDYFTEEREDNNASATPVVLADGAASRGAGTCAAT